MLLSHPIPPFNYIFAEPKPIFYRGGQKEKNCARIGEQYRLKRETERRLRVLFNRSVTPSSLNQIAI